MTEPLCIVRGSINNDEYFHVDHIARPGETLSSTNHALRIGGKGANQAVTVARAGGRVQFYGAIGKDGLWLKEKMHSEGVDASGISVVDEMPTGRAIIQVDKDGENSIILFPGANHSNLPELLFQKASSPSSPDADYFPPCTHLLLQNEILLRCTLAALANAAPAVTVVLNPSPLPTPAEIVVFPWYRVDWLLVNAGEARELCNAIRLSSSSDEGDDAEAKKTPLEADTDPRVLVETLARAPPFRKTNVVCTLGAQGVLARLSNAYWETVPESETYTSTGGQGSSNININKLIYVPAARLQGSVRDTTGAGDCFAGYFVAGLMELGAHAKVGNGIGMREVAGVLRKCVVAAGMCVEKRGTIDSVPTQEEVAKRILELSA